MLVIAAPGQGAQTPGFLFPWLELPGFADRLGAWSELAGCDLIKYGTTAERRRDQGHRDRAAAARRGRHRRGGALLGGLDAGPGAHRRGRRAQRGELAAGAIAGVLTAEDAMRLVRVRGEAMAKAAAIEPTGMTAVLGGDEAEVLAAIEAHGLTPANINGAGQIVAAGTLAQLAAFAADPPAGARLRPLQVAGAFHTRHMAPAVDALRDAQRPSVTVSDPVLPLLSNPDGAACATGADWLERIVTQVSAPVRWDLCMRTMTAWASPR